MTEVKNIVYTGMFQGWSENNIIMQIMFKIATNEEVELLSICDIENLSELKAKAEKLYNRYGEEYYKEY